MPPRSGTRGGARVSGTRSDLLDHYRSGVRAPNYLAGGNVTQKFASSGTLQTLIDLRQRILDEAKGSKSEVSKRLQLHRQRTWDMAFGQPTGDGVEVSTIEISLICPYSRTALRHPVRSRDCQHLQCCDLESWISLLDKCRSMRDPRAPCPVCEKRVVASSLEMDCWQLHVLSQMPPKTHMLILDPDGSYRSGDVSRDKRKQQVTEVIDWTQRQNGGSSDVSVASSPDPAFSTPVASDAGFSRVKRERVSEDAPDLSLSDFPGASGCPTQDEDVVMVRYVEGVQTARVLPSQLRLWVAHCPGCTKTLLKEEGGEVECCAQCGMEKKDWTLVRSFPGSRVSLELTRDNTLILCGADALAPRLSRAGFFRAFFATEGDACSLHRDAGLWYTTTSFTRYELDFLEACCERLASGETVEDMPVVPPIFRTSRRRLVRPQIAPA